MTATYQATLLRDRDWVRFLTGDTDTSNPHLQDEEIEALIAAEAVASPAVRYYAAASALTVIKTRLAGKGRGITSKSISRLSISWGIDGTSAMSIDDRIKDLRMSGAGLLAVTAGTTPTFIRMR